jgi:hypothetical protein
MGVGHHPGSGEARTLSHWAEVWKDPPPTAPYDQAHPSELALAFTPQGALALPSWLCGFREKLGTWPMKRPQRGCSMGTGTSVRQAASRHSLKLPATLPPALGLTPGRLLHVLNCSPGFP